MAQAATQKQVNYLLSLGATADQVKDLSVISASAMIKRLLKDKKENIKEKSSEYQHGYKVGDILYMSWGYEQTNLDFFKVVATTEKTVRLVEVTMKVKEQDGGFGSMARDVSFDTTTATPLERSYAIKDQIKGDIKRVCSYEYNGVKTNYIAINNHHLQKYNGEKLYESWYA